MDDAADRPPNPTEFEILVSLAGQDRHGYAIMQDFERRSGGAVLLGPGTLYGAIKRMLDAGWIREVPTRGAASADARRRCNYRLTPAGRAAAGRVARRLAELVRAAADGGLLSGEPAR
jgi:DNA-binding PadR family transcriptional regulator